MAEAAATPTNLSWPNPAFLGLAWAEMFEKSMTSWTETSGKFALTAIDTVSMQAKTLAAIGARFKAAAPKVSLTLVPPVAEAVEKTVLEAAPPEAEPIVEPVVEPIVEAVAVTVEAAEAIAEPVVEAPIVEAPVMVEPPPVVKPAPVVKAQPAAAAPPVVKAPQAKVVKLVPAAKKPKKKAG